mgnify:CR=1 FL=1
MTHIQLNTNGIRIARIWFEEGKEHAIDYVARLRRVGVNTVYLSFDGVTPKTNPKNHWEIPYILEAFRHGGMTSIVLVPTVINGYNTNDLGAIIRFASENINIIRGINIQPISITGSVPRNEREKLRITIPDVIRLIEEQTDGQIGRDAWYPVPWTYAISRFIEAFTMKPQLVMTNDPACGVATYVYPHIEYRNGSKVVTGYTPITEFVDVEALYDYLLENAQYLEEKSGFRRKLRKARVALSLLWRLRSFINRSRVPEGLNIRKLIINIFLKRNYSALGDFHYKFLFIGMMHFMDLYNYDIQRVMRCSIHYLVPDGRLIPFCAFNVLSEIYRDKIQKEYGVPLDEWIKQHGPHTIGEHIKYRRDVKRLTKSEIYMRYYQNYVSMGS